MQIWLNYLLEQSLTWAFLIIFLVAFFESLAIIGLLLPGAVVMATLGTLIGKGYLKLYPLCFFGFLGCILGDWISYFIGRKLKNKIYNISFVKKYRIILDKISYTLYNHNTSTIFFGRFFGYTRSLIPLVSGMIKLPIKKFFFPNLLGCVIWTPLYFIPGIFAGIVMDIYGKNSIFFNIFLFIIFTFFWVGIWLCWNIKNYNSNPENWLFYFIPIKILKWIGPIIFIIGISGLILIQFLPIMKIFRVTLWKILFE